MYKRGKQLLAIMLMLALCFTTASMAFAQRAGGAPNAMGHMGNGGTGHGTGHGGGQGQHGKGMHTVKGTVVAIDQEALTMTVNVTHAGVAQAGLVGQDIIFSIDPNAVVMVMGLGLGTLDDIFVDDVVKVKTKLVNTDYVAYRIMVY